MNTLGGLADTELSIVAHTIQLAVAPGSTGAEHDRLIGEIRILDKRIAVVNWAIFLSVLSALLTCAVVVLLFASYLADANLGTLVALLFMGSMLSIGAGFAIFLIETRLGSRVIHIRNEILYHQSEGDERGGPGRTDG